MTERQIIARLVAWAELMGSWDAPVWEDAREMVICKKCGRISSNLDAGYCPDCATETEES